MNIEDFDIIAYLESKGMEYHTSGKNVTQGWIEINCPFPVCDDPSWHLGINLDSKIYHCYICGSKGGPINLIMEIEQCSFPEADKIFKTFREDILNTRDDLEEIEDYKTDNIKNILPKESTTEFPKKYSIYLKSRNFNPIYLQRKYQLKTCGILGNYKFRIIVPFYLNKKLITFTGLDITGRSDLKYKHSKKEDSIIEVKNTLYNIDSVEDKAIIVEGVTDVFRIGDASIATMGVAFTNNQLSMIAQKRLKEVLIIYDSDAIDIGHKLGNQLSGITEVSIIELDSGDPEDLSAKDVQEIRTEFF